MPDLREWQFIGKYRRLSESSRELVNMVIDHELSRREEKPSVNSPESKIIPLYLTPAAAGYASPALGDDYEDYAVEKGSAADFAVRIAGDSMEPVYPRRRCCAVQARSHYPRRRHRPVLR